MEPEIDAYQILQVAPHAEDFVLEAAYRVLARHYHPDGTSPDTTKMAEINRAYDLVRTTERRKRYDRMHRTRPMGPGTETLRPTMGEPSAQRVAAASGSAPPVSSQDGPTVDFGRYAGWSVKDLAKHDPDYLRWLSRHSSGVRYRNLITQLLPPETVVTSKTKY